MPGCPQDCLGLQWHLPWYNITVKSSNWPSTKKMSRHINYYVKSLRKKKGKKRKKEKKRDCQMLHALGAESWNSEGVHTCEHFWLRQIDSSFALHSWRTWSARAQLCLLCWHSPACCRHGSELWRPHAVATPVGRYKNVCNAQGSKVNMRKTKDKTSNYTRLLHFQILRSDYYALCVCLE